jgi:membrane protein
VKTRIGQVHQHLRDFLRLEIWDQDIDRLPWWRGFLFRQIRVWAIFGRGFVLGRIQLRASAMTFTTLVTMGPVLVLTLSVLQAVGVLQGLGARLEGYLVDNISPGSLEQVRAWLFSFMEAVRRGAFRGLSIMVLIGGVLALLTSIEGAFNDIWGIHRGRSLFQRFSIYTTLIVFGPILVGLSLSLRTSIEHSSLRLWLESMSPMLRSLTDLGLKLLPVLFTGIALTLLYTIMPNVRVRLRASLPAGLLAGLFWEISRYGYTTYVRVASHYGTLYGSLAAIPLFMIWVFVSWLVVLAGAQLAFARDAAQDFRLEEGAQFASQRERLRVALHLAMATARSYLAGEDPPELVILARGLHLPLRLVRIVAEELVDGGLLHLVAPNRRETSLVPARSPETITVYDIIICLFDRGGSFTEAGEPPTVVEDLLSDIDGNWSERWGNLSLKDLLQDQKKRDDQGILPIPLKGWHGRPGPGDER